jgi:His-Xaa-Ser system radical SAM maturase HxsB
MMTAQTRRLGFLPQEHFQAQAAYSLLPCSFAAVGEQYVLTNLVGEYVLLSRPQLVEFVGKRLAPDAPLYRDLQAKHFLLDDTSDVALELLAAKVRTKLANLASFTALHIFVTTLRCNNRCVYCQVSSQSADRARYDMNETVAEQAVRFMFHSPSPHLKVEFQGGESLLNFPIVEFIVNRVRHYNRRQRRAIEFVICTNLTVLTDQILAFLSDNDDVYVSMSLDGPEELHNANRPHAGGNSYQRTLANLRRVQEAIGPHRISALMTTTRATLAQPERVIDEYVRQGFTSIFLRSLNPYGRASVQEYTSAEWNAFYARALDYIISINQRGVPLREEYAALVLRKLLTPHGTGFVDLQSPTGAGTGVLLYNYNGNIYPADEARMLAEMGDEFFLLGNVCRTSYEDVVFSDKLVAMIKDTMLEGVPGCADCAFRPYCGVDPVKHYRLQGDVIGHKPTSEFCEKNQFLFRHLISLLERNPVARRVLSGWS